MKVRLFRPVFTSVLVAIVVSSLLGCDLIKLPQVQGALATLTASAGNQATAAPKRTISGKATAAGKATVAVKATAEGEATAEDSATATPKATTASKATAVAKVTAKPKASATPELVTQGLQLLEQGFGQKDQQVAYGMVIENPGDTALVDSQYQVTIYDAEGTVLDTGQGYLALVLAGQKLGIAGSAYLNEGQVADMIEIVLESGEAAETDFNAPITTDQVIYNEDEYISVALGLVSNPFDLEVGNVDVWGIAYDAAGNIIGGGNNTLNFITAGSSSGIALSITSKGTVARVEFSAALANSTPWDDSSDRVGVEQVTLGNQGFGQKDTQVAYGALIQNASADSAAENIYLHITFFADNGDVVAVEDNYLQVILPSETQAIAGPTYLPEGVTVGGIDIQYRVNLMVPVSDLPSLTSENVNYLDDDYSPKVTGQIVNPYDIKLENVQVVVIAYDADGAIIGGGAGYIEFISAGKKAAVEIYLTASGIPDSLEMYATVNQLSDLTQ